MATTEICCGCGRESGKQGYRIVAVVRAADGFVHKPVCDTCHADPSSRTTVIKGHFFEKSHAARAVALAGSDSIRG